MKSPKKISRLAGLIGILVLGSGSFAYSVNSRLIVQGDGLKTAENVIESEFLFRIAFASGLSMEVIFIFYALFLFALLKSVNKGYALLMLVLALVPAPMFLMNQLNQFAILPLAKEQDYSQMMFFLSMHRTGGFVISIFFGLWLLPLGYLVFKSNFLPKVLGVFLMIGCFGYLIGATQGLLFPGSEATLWTNPALIVTHLSEISLMLWLLAMGVNEGKYLTNFLPTD